MHIDDNYTLIPQLGLALVRQVDMGQTKGGIVLPSRTETPGDGKHLEIVECSEGYLQGEKLIKVDLRKGDRVTLAPQSVRGRQLHWPKDIFIVHVGHVIAVERPEGN